MAAKFGVNVSVGSFKTLQISVLSHSEEWLISNKTNQELKGEKHGS
ncbi:hypothetical protein [Campylobacter majalis]